MKIRKILMVLPIKDYDPTEAGVAFYQLSIHGHQVSIATIDGSISRPDQLMLTGKGLGIFKSILMADKNGRSACYYMLNSKSYNNPLNFSQIDANEFDVLILPGGHDKGMREYLESKILQQKVLDFHISKKLIAAICHGVIVLARTIDEKGNSILYNKNVTSLLKKQEKLAYYLTKWFLSDYYLTYPITVEDEVKSKLHNPNQFKTGISNYNWLNVALLKRDSLNNYYDSFVVLDGNILTARWPGDIHLFSLKILNIISK